MSQSHAHTRYMQLETKRADAMVEIERIAREAGTPLTNDELLALKAKTLDELRGMLGQS